MWAWRLWLTYILYERVRKYIMNPVNLYELTRLTDYEKFYDYEKYLSQRREKKPKKEHSREHELDTLRAFVEEIICQYNDISLMSYFYFSYKIPQIGKEFDLLRINEDSIINIELKSEKCSDEKIITQFKRNKYYLSFLNKKIKFYSYTLQNNKLMLLENGILKDVSFDDLIKELTNQNQCFTGNLNKKFDITNYLISPLNTPKEFLENKYFLTNQQEEKKNYILKKIETKGQKAIFCGITGKAGTGKTLLLYDIAKDKNKIANEKICIIHCGMLSKGHLYLNKNIDNIEIVAAKELDDNFNYDRYTGFFVDECHRMYLKQFQKLTNHIKKHNKFAVFSYDDEQKLQKKEEIAGIVKQMKLLDNFCEGVKLSEKIRSNPEIASFIKKLFNLNSLTGNIDYKAIKIIYAKNSEEAKNIIRLNSDYTFINYTVSNYYSCSFDSYVDIQDKNTHEVIGQEYDKVITIIDENFFYDKNNILCGKSHPNPDYIFRQLLFQALTRCRKQLAIVIVNNMQLLKNILNTISKDDKK